MINAIPRRNSGFQTFTDYDCSLLLARHSLLKRDLEGEVKQVAAAIAFNEGSVLLTRRAVGQNLSGFWEFPGGKLEPGESAADCIVRELEEELGIQSVAGKVIVESVHHYPGGSINLIAIEVHLLDQRFQLSVHDEAEFVPPASLLSMKLAPADVPIAEELVRRATAPSENL